MVDVSVVIPAYNEEKSIAKTLDSLVAQKTKSSFETIVVDNNSTDKTNAISKKYSKKLRITVIKEKRKGRGVARATGFARSRGEIILSIDADTIAPPNWIAKMTAKFADKDIVAVTGPWRITDCDLFTNVCVNRLQEVANFPYKFIMGHYWLNGLNFGIRKSAYVKAGGFDKTLNAHEDIELTTRVRKLGKILYSRDVVVTQSGRRYKDGLLLGLWDYQKTAFSYFVLGDKSKVLDDRR
jgi:glycosyltransferase involved in cell wall biosynthesis